jgi:SulP family sulfate permease
VLAGIRVTVGIGIIDYKGIRHLKSIPLSDAVIMFIVLLLTVFVDLLVAVAAGMVLASFVFMKKTADIVEGESKSISLKDFQSESVWEDEKELVEHLGNKVYIKHIEGPLFFGMIAGFKELFKSLPETVETVVIRMDKVPYVDQSGLYAMEEVVTDLKQKGIKVLFWKLGDQPKVMFQKIDIIPDLVSEEECFDSAEGIEEYLKKNQ